MQKALTNTPLTYLLGQPTSHGKLQSLCIKVEIEAKNILLLVCVYIEYWFTDTVYALTLSFFWHSRKT